MREGAGGSADREWLDRELAGCRFKDVRLAKRFRKLIQQAEGAVGESIPLACQDWANTKAAYRFFANERVSEGDILSSHFDATGERAAAEKGLLLVLHDTTEFSFHRDQPEAIGFTRSMHKGRHQNESGRHRKVCGLLMHSALTVTTDALPLGLAAAKFWTRKQFKGAEARRKRGNLKRMPIADKESARWPENLRLSSERLGAQRCVHVADREGDIYEFFCEAAKIGTHFLVRSKVDRWVGDGEHTIAEEMDEVKLQGVHRIDVTNERRETREATLEVRYRKLRVLAPKTKQSHLPPLMLTVIHALERDPPKDGKGIEWKLITDLPVSSRAEAIEKLEWYALRWKIEVFHKILKSGYKIEESKLRTADRLVNLIALCCILSWRIFWMTMVNRSDPAAPPSLVLTDIEMRLLDHLVRDQTNTPPRGVSRYLFKIARLGGYLGRTNDPPPGNKLMWKGFTRFVDIVLGATAGAEIVGN
jgi:hypothetical protein